MYIYICGVRESRANRLQLNKLHKLWGGAGASQRIQFPLLKSASRTTRTSHVAKGRGGLISRALCVEVNWHLGAQINYQRRSSLMFIYGKTYSLHGRQTSILLRMRSGCCAADCDSEYHTYNIYTRICGTPIISRALQTSKCQVRCARPKFVSTSFKRTLSWEREKKAQTRVTTPQEADDGWGNAVSLSQLWPHHICI